MPIMKIRLYQVDAFTNRVFAGNPAAVCPLPHWPSDEWMQKVAMENNLAETGFFVRKENRYEIRWFTPTIEVDLCGHATLAAAHVIFNHENYIGDEITFHSHRSGILKVRGQGDLLTLDFPTDRFEPVKLSDELIRPFGTAPQEAYKGKTDYMLVFGQESQIKSLSPDLPGIARIKDCRGIIVTAPGDQCDFVSRFFAPQSGIDEDPVTGSAHTTLTPYWTHRLGKKTLTAVQLSARQGHLRCELHQDRTLIGGQARTFMIGEILESF